MTAWIEWNGGECPVPADTPVRIQFRSGDSCEGGRARATRWDHTGSQGDIIAYQILSDVEHRAALDKQEGI